MAAAEHKLSRRAVLAGACAAPVLPLGEIRWGQPDRLSPWQKALACYRRAEAAVEAAGRGDDDARYERALGRHNAALARLLRAPAPDLGAVAEKLELILRHSVFELTFAEPCLAALRRDVRAFAGL